MAKTKDEERRGLRRIFLFRKKPDRLAPVFWAYNFVMITAFAILSGVFSLTLAYGNYPSEIFFGYFKIPMIAFLNILPVVVLTYLVYFIVGRAWIAHLTVSGLVLATSIADYFKLRFRDDPIIAADVSSITTGLKVSANYDLTIGKRVLAVILFLVLSTLILAFFVRGHIRFRFRAIGIALALFAVWPTAKACLDDTTFASLKNFDYPGASRWSDTQKQITRGFVYPLIHSIPDAIPERPEGYSDALAKEILSAYVPEDIPEEKKVNYIIIQLEAFNDFERLGVEGIDEKVYAGYRKIESEGYVGSIVTNIFAGGTIDTERCFMTGYYKLDNFRGPVGSYVRYFKDQGYFAEGTHACYDWFYNRKNINRYIGFDRYYFVENRYTELFADKMRDGVGYDDLMIPDILSLYLERDKTAPYLNFSITYQGHGPYPDSYLKWGDGYYTGDGLSDASRTILNNYLGSVCDTSDRLLTMTDALRKDPDPVVLVLYGDHNPWLGDGNSVYNELGINLDLSTEEGFYNYFGTRYVIWANEAAKKALGKDIKGEGPAVSPCYMMNVLFDVCGLGKGPAYLQLMGELMQKCTVINTTGFIVEDGKYTTEPSEELNRMIADMKIAQYYRKGHPEA